MVASNLGLCHVAADMECADTFYKENGTVENIVLILKLVVCCYQSPEKAEAV